MRQQLDPFWEKEIYGKGHLFALYPFDIVVSSVCRWRPRYKQVGETDIIEVGCGAENNIWFAAREGFRVSGIDVSGLAVKYAKGAF